MARKARVGRSNPVFETLESRSLLSATGIAVAAESEISARVATTAAAPAAPVGLGTGITGEYFAGNNFQQPVLVRTDATINFPSGFRPDPDLATGAFSVQWTGQLEPLFSQTYTFSTQTTGGVRLSVDGQSLINSWTVQTRQNNSATITLAAGQKYDIEMDYSFSGPGGPLARLLWSSQSQHREAVQEGALFPNQNVALPPGAGLIGEYFLGRNFQQQVLTRNDKVINFTFGSRKPDPVIRQTSFSIRLIGEITPTYSETYTFYTRADDGVLLYVNGQMVVNDFTVHPVRTRDGTIALQAGVTYAFMVEYFEDNIPPATLQVSWSSPSTPKEVIPASAFSNVGQLTAGAVQVTGTTTSEIDLAWAGSLAATGYIVQRSSDGATGWTQIGSTAAGTTTYADTGLASDITYYYRIIATDAVENSNPDNPVSGTTLVPSVPPTLAAPIGVNASADSSTQITVTWNPVTGATDYTVQQSTTPDGSSGWISLGNTGGATQLVSSGLTPATAYYYQVTAINLSAESAPSAIATATTLNSTVLAAPTDLTASATSDTTATLNWNDVTGETGFTIQSSPDGVSNWTTAATVGAGVTTLNIGGLTPSTTYYYRVIATNSSESSAPSNVANATTDAAFPSYATLTTIYGLGGSNIYSIDPATGAATSIGTISFATEAAGRDPVTGKLFYISTDPSNVQIATWDPTAPTASANTTVNDGIAVPGIVQRATFRSDGTLFFTAGLGALYSFNTTTNTAVALGTIESGGDPLPGSNGDMAFAPDGNLYVEANSEMYEVNGSDINAAGGSGSIIPATLLGPTGTGNLQIAFGQNGVLFGYDDNGQIYSVSLATGAATAIPGSTPSGTGMGDLASVPLYADLTIGQTASTLTAGSNGTYTFTVANSGPNATNRPITITNALPAGLSFVSGAGLGWTFNVQGQTVTLIYAGNVASGTTLPTVTLTVAVSNSAPASVTNTAIVSTAIFDPDIANDTSMLTTDVGM